MSGKKPNSNSPSKKGEYVRGNHLIENNEVSDVEFVDVEAIDATNNNEEIRAEQTSPDTSSSDDKTEEEDTGQLNDSKEPSHNTKVDDTAETTRDQRQLCQDNTVGSTQDSDGKNTAWKSKEAFQAARTAPLPDGWQQKRHQSGLPLYLHASSRVCTLSEPYYLASSRVRDHDIPSGLLPCVACRAILEGRPDNDGDQRRGGEMVVNETPKGTARRARAKVVNKAKRPASTSDAEGGGDSESSNEQDKKKKRR